MKTRILSTLIMVIALNFISEAQTFSYLQGISTNSNQPSMINYHDALTLQYPAGLNTVNLYINDLTAGTQFFSSHTTGSSAGMVSIPISGITRATNDHININHKYEVMIVDCDMVCDTSATKYYFRFLKNAVLHHTDCNKSLSMWNPSNKINTSASPQGSAYNGFDIIYYGENSLPITGFSYHHLTGSTGVYPSADLANGDHLSFFDKYKAVVKVYDLDGVPQDSISDTCEVDFFNDATLHHTQCGKSDLNLNDKISTSLKGTAGSFYDYREYRWAFYTSPPATLIAPSPNAGHPDPSGAIGYIHYINTFNGLNIPDFSVQLVDDNGIDNGAYLQNNVTYWVTVSVVDLSNYTDSLYTDNTINYFTRFSNEGPACEVEFVDCNASTAYANFFVQLGVSGVNNGSTYSWSTGDTTETINVPLNDTSISFPVTVEINDSKCGTITKCFSIADTTPAWSECPAPRYLHETNIINGTATIREISIYPNPTQGSFLLEISSLRYDNNVEIKDLSGKSILQKKIEAGSNLKLDIDLSNIPNGIYFIHFDGIDGLEPLRIIKD